MTYHLTGDPAWIVALLAILGAMHILAGIETWLLERISIDLHPYRLGIKGNRKAGKGSVGWDLWIGIPRRFKASLRWDRPGAMVRFEDGREGCVLGSFDMDDSPCPVALVQPYDEDDNPSLQCPEWLPLTALSPLPRAVAQEVPSK